ncbi:MAG: hypothetical protein GF341_10035 [candidate division Zixibacteria bacterium]|nr:hypothetical protein [candidate division Zixibacteria bacterium]
MKATTAFAILLMGLCVLPVISSSRAQAELLEFDDVADSMIAATHVSSANATGWNDPTLYVGDVFNYRYHILVAVNDTSHLQSLVDGYALDSAALSVVIGSTSGSPGALDCHVIRRDSTGTGIYPAYDDRRSYHCRSEWYGRKAALPFACPDSILWEIPGATGPTDYHPVPFVSVASPIAGQRYDIDVTPWIAGIVAGVDSVSNGIILLASTEDGSGSDYLTVGHIYPFKSYDDRMILKVWRSETADVPPTRAWLDSPDMLK